MALPLESEGYAVVQAVDADGAAVLGAVDYLEQPIDFDRLLGTIAAWC